MCESVWAPLPHAIRPRKAEEFLKGKSIDDRLFEEAASIAAGETRPRTRAEYRREMTKLLVEQALKRGHKACRNGGWPMMEQIKVTVNGEEYEMEVPAHRTLLDFLRQDLELMGPSQGARPATAVPAPCSWTASGQLLPGIGR